MPRKITPAKEKTASPDAEVKSVDEQKAAALNLWEKDEKKGSARGLVGRRPHSCPTRTDWAVVTVQPGEQKGQGAWARTR